jgi:acetylornithine deacetylase/succinyl-diaminopimelate desuccinylase-like protein
MTATSSPRRAPGAKEGVLLMAHIDVVDKQDWERSPFTLFEENGFLRRGTADMRGRRLSGST